MDGCNKFIKSRTESYYQEGSERAERVRRLFTKIAGRYDLINDLQSGGLHRLWKRRLISSLKPRPGSRVLDLACGSGDLTFRLLRAHADVDVVGGDFTHSMLKVARGRRPSSDSRPKWIQLDGLALPFASGTLDAVMMAYGLRNMADPKAALRETARVLKPGGRAAILDFGKPRNPILRSLYFFFLRTVQPALGWLFFRDRETYRYIYESLQRYPAQTGVTRLMEEAGFEEIQCIDLTGGMMSLHLAIRAFPTSRPSE